MNSGTKCEFLGFPLSVLERSEEKEDTQMDERIWGPLPEHLIERILPWMTVPSIVRSRSVCRSWNSLVNSDNFMRLYSEASVSRRHKPWFLVFPTNSENEKAGVAYDPLENRWMSLSLSFLPVECRAVATAGGLICMFPKASNSNSLYMCNPISKSWKKLERPFGLLRFIFLVADLVVDKSSGFYKVVLAGSELVTGVNDQFILTAEVFDSETGGWRRSRSFLVEAPVHPWKAISNGVLYCVIGHANNNNWNIIGFRIVEGHWFRVSAPMPPSLTIVKLMDSNGRLLLIGGIGFGMADSNVTEEIAVWELNSKMTEWKRIGGICRQICDGFLRSTSRRFACVGQDSLVYFTSKKCSYMLVYNLSCHTCHWIPYCENLSEPHHHVLNAFCFQPRLQGLL